VGTRLHFSGFATLPAKLFDPRALTRESSANRFWPVIFVLIRTSKIHSDNFAGSAFTALSGVRLLVGTVAFGSAVGVLKATGDRLHIDAIRMPMLALLRSEEESRVDSVCTGSVDVGVAGGGRVGALEVARKRMSIS
jgi:hypothetical protein